MPELAGRYSYWLLIGVTVSVMGLLFVLLRRAKWI
jgi:magnesium transporter